MHSQRWMFTSPGGENEYKKPSVTRQHYDAVVEAKKAREENLVETESGESHAIIIVVTRDFWPCSFLQRSIIWPNHKQMTTFAY